MSTHNEEKLTEQELVETAVGDFVLLGSEEKRQIESLVEPTSTSYSQQEATSTSANARDLNAQGNGVGVATNANARIDFGFFSSKKGNVQSEEDNQKIGNTGDNSTSINVNVNVQKGCCQIL